MGNYMKKPIYKLKSLVKFTKDSAVPNENRINILKKTAGRFLIVTNTDYRKVKLHLHIRNSGRLNVHSVP